MIDTVLNLLERDPGNMLLGIAIGVVILMGLVHYIHPNITSNFYRGRFLEAIFAGGIVIFVWLSMFKYMNGTELDREAMYACLDSGDYLGFLLENALAGAYTAGMFTASLVYFR
jgi:hypothetical protein